MDLRCTNNRRPIEIHRRPYVSFKMGVFGIVKKRTVERKGLIRLKRFERVPPFERENAKWEMSRLKGISIFGEMESLRALVQKKRQEKEEEFGGRRFVRRGEIEEKRLKRLREAEEKEIALKAITSFYSFFLYPF